MTDEQYEKAEELHNSRWSNEQETHKAIEVHKDINVTNCIAKAIKAIKRAAIVQVQDFDTPDCEYTHYDEEGHGAIIRY